MTLNQVKSKISLAINQSHPEYRVQILGDYLRLRVRNNPYTIKIFVRPYNGLANEAYRVKVIDMFTEEFSELICYVEQDLYVSKLKFYRDIDHNGF